MSTALPELRSPDPDLRTRTTRACKHCGSPLLDQRALDSGFCCNGCSYVHRLLHEEGLDAYYKVKDAVTSPADPAVFQPRDTSWIEELQREAEQSASDRSRSRNPNHSLDPAGSPDEDEENPRERERLRLRERGTEGIPEMTVSVQGISCAGCVWLIERVFRQQPGARSIVVSPHHGTMRLRWTPGEFSTAAFARKLQSLGYLTGPAGDTTAEPESRPLVRRIGLCAAFAMNVMLYALPAYFGMDATFEYARLFGTLTALFGTLSFLVGGTYFLGRAVAALREGAMHIDLPIAIGIVGAFAGSVFGWLAGIEALVYFDFLSAFILLMLVGRWAQVAAVERNRRRLLSHQPAPRRVRVADGTETSPEKLATGQAFELDSAQTLPVESRLESARALFSLASINGESEPRLFLCGQRVPAGAVNAGREPVALAALEGWSDSLLARLLEPRVREGGRHRLLENIVKGYLAGILGIAAVSGAWWWFATHDAVQTWSVVTAVLVVSCPCAIGLAFPLADEMATVGLRRRGVFVLDGDLWSRLGRVRTLVFDKTGTLTLETPVLLNPEALTTLDEEARLALHTLVRDNPHPISQCLLEHLLALESIERHAIPGTALHETIGQGVEFGSWSLGRPGWRGGQGAGDGRQETEGPNRQTAEGVARSSGSPPVTCPLSPVSCGVDTVLAHSGDVVARFRFADAARPDARVELATLARGGFDAFILSGDRSEKVVSLATELGLPASHAVGDMSPSDKAAWLDARARNTLMLGDGANDSLAFESALCRGTPVIHRGVLERKSDFYYLGRGIAGIRALLETDAARRQTQIAILAFSVLYNVAAVGLAVAGMMSPLVAAVLMPVNSLLTLGIVGIGMRRVIRG